MIFCLIAAGAQADIRIQPSSPDFLIAEDFADGMLIVQTFTNPPRIDTLFLSTDNGETWEWFGAGESSDTLLTYVFSFASDGDSSFFYALFDCSDELPHNLWLEMINRISSIGFFGYIQPDEVNAHYASGCTDHFRSGHWIYICVVDTNPPTPAIALMFLRSTDYGNDWFPLVDSYPILVRDPHLAAGAGHRIYFAGVTGNSNDTLIIWTNLDRLDPAQWVRYTMSTDGDRIEAPLLAASFNPVDSLATVWCAYARNRNNSGNWDIECVYSTDGGINWSEPVALAGSPNFEERYFDLKPNRHFNPDEVAIAYIASQAGDNSVYLRLGTASQPNVWTEPQKVNAHNAQPGKNVRPRICYLPLAPERSPGVVYVAENGNGVYWTTYCQGIEEKPAYAASHLRVVPTVGPGPFRIVGLKSDETMTVTDISGRVVRRLVTTGNTAIWDGRDNNGNRVAPGVYLIRGKNQRPRSVIYTGEND